MGMSCEDNFKILELTHWPDLTSLVIQMEALFPMEMMRRPKYYAPCYYHCQFQFQCPAQPKSAITIMNSSFASFRFCFQSFPLPTIFVSSFLRSGFLK